VRLLDHVLLSLDRDVEAIYQHELRNHPMHGFIKDIETLTVANKDFRQVVYTAKNCQLVLMSLKPMEEIGMETHKLDQFFRVEAGSGEAILDGVTTKFAAGFAIIVPAGTKHNIVNTGNDALKLYTIYSPPNHRDGVVHHTRADALKDKEHFDGKTTEVVGAEPNASHGKH
jgi:mannose-6-phosphate isomerase-like protein (cupin superfamily)